MPQSPLHAVHERAGARFTEFGRWRMPLQFEGVIAEHLAVRERVGVFDVSHLGRFTVSGPGAVDVVRRLLCNDICRIERGRAQYSMALNERGGVVDDIIVWWVDDDTLWVLPNGVNFDAILERFRNAAPATVTVEAVRSATALLAVQGPMAAAVVERTIGVMPRRFRVETGSYEGKRFVAAGTGYTGERGAEIAVPVPVAERLWSAVVASGATPCGLGSRDTLRLEMGYPLWGQDLDEETTPLEAGLEWVVDWDHDFVGRNALVDQRHAGVAKLLVGFRTGSRRIARHGYPMRAGQSVGEVASGNYSPLLEQGVGLGYLSPPPPEDRPIEVEIRGEWHEVERWTPPFIER
jgi:aminomethyltransferase